ncbi:hypothetical protein AALB39_01060 [Lachnospiraceae bacterium 54-53]
MLNWERNRSGLNVFLEKDFPQEGRPYLCQLRTRDNSLIRPLTHGSCVMDLSELHFSCNGATVMLFEEQTDLSHLTAIAKPLFF